MNTRWLNADWRNKTFVVFFLTIIKDMILRITYSAIFIKGYFKVCFGYNRNLLFNFFFFSNLIILVFSLYRTLHSPSTAACHQDGCFYYSQGFWLLFQRDYLWTNKIFGQHFHFIFQLVWFASLCHYASCEQILF